MKKNISQEAFYDRMRQLAEVDKISVKESSNRTLGSLIDYKRAADGVAYGIVKENHHYYIKKAGLKQDPDVADFAYIGGLQNIKEFQYKSLAEADKNRNMILRTINEAINTVVNKTDSKRKLNEDIAGEEIAKAEEKLGDAEAAASAPEPEAEPFSAEPAPDDESLPEPDGESVPEDDESLPEPDGESVPEDDENENTTDTEVNTTPNDGEENNNATTKEIEKLLGKITDRIRKTEMTNSQVKSYVNTFLAAFKDKFPNVEIEDRKAMADKIIKVIPNEEIKNLSSSVPQDNKKSVKEAQCTECGSFAMYAKSRGYGNAQALMECSSEEVANLVSGYGTAYVDGMNDGDLKNVALVIKIVDPNILNSLKNDYGHEEYANKLAPIVQNMNESTEEENIAKLNELFGGLKSVGQFAMGGIKAGVQKGAQAVNQAVQKGAQAVNQAAQTIKQTYHAGEVSNEIKKLEGIANDLGAQIAALNTRLQKAGKQPVNVNSILTTIKNQVGRGGTANLAGKIQETMDDIQKFNAQPPVQQLQEEEPEIEKNKFSFSPEAQSLGAGVIKPESAGTINIDVNGADKNVSIAVNEVISKFKEVLDKINEMNGGNKVPSAGFSNENKSEVKGREHIGKKGKGFEKVAAAKRKNVKNENVDVKKQMSESEQKLRAYIRKRLEENIGIRKPTINENKKSDALRKLDAIIDEQFKLFESQFSKWMK